MQSSEQPPESRSDTEPGERPKKKYFSFGLAKYIFCLIIPFVLMPLALSKYKETRCAYVILWMVIYWVLQPVDFAVTALLPVPLYPLLGILDSSKVTPNYMKEVLMMFFGGLGVAIAVEHSALHKRIALKVLVTIGTEIKWLLFGFMYTAMFLSMWLSNSASTAMMVPIIDAVMEELRIKEDETMDEENESPAGNGPDIKQLHKTLLLGVAYSCNFGGTGTITGTGPNLIFKGFMDTDFPDSYEVTYATWMLYNIPGMILGVFAAWIVLQVVYAPCWRKEDPESKERIKTVITTKYQEMGPMTFHEAGVLFLFVVLVFLWVFREPKFIPGWASALDTGTNIYGAVPAILIFFVMFALPAKPWMLHKSPPLLTWKVIHEKMPWGLILLIGGGYAMADGAKSSGLSGLISHELSALGSLSPMAVVLIVFIITSVFTEAVSNSAITAIFLPVVIDMAITFQINPLYLMLPVPIASSYAFMLPVATGGNAIVFATGRLKTIDMAKPGILMKIIAIFLQLFMHHTLGDYMFNFGTYPSWANATTHA